MAKTLTVAGVNFLPRYKTNSGNIRETVQNKSGVMDLQFSIKAGQAIPQEGAEFIFKDGSRFLFGGYISRTKPTEIGKADLLIYDIEVSDYSYIFNNKIARRAYQNQTLKYIVEDLMDTYVDAGYAFTTTNVTVGPTIDSVTFDHISIRKCFEKLQKLTGYVWYVDYEKNIFFTMQTADPAPESITDTSENFQSISISYDMSQVRNAVTVIGSDDGEQSESYTEETFTGDGETRSWELEDKPSEVLFISINGVNQQFSLDVNLRDTDVFTYSFSGQSFALTAAPTTPTGSDTIVIRYYPRVPIIARKDDQDSIDLFATLDGGDGVYEYTIKESSITSKATATERALQELSEFATPLVNGTFVTRTSLLSGGSIFTPGQVITVNLPSYGIVVDAAFLVQEVNINLNEDENTGVNEYIYTVRFGGKLVGVREFLESLASEGGEVSDSTKILTLEKADDTVEMEDDVTRTIYTPPFKWGSGGSPQGKWNLSEWA